MEIDDLVKLGFKRDKFGFFLGTNIIGISYTDFTDNSSIDNTIDFNKFYLKVAYYNIKINFESKDDIDIFIKCLGLDNI